MPHVTRRSFARCGRFDAGQLGGILSQLVEVDLRELAASAADVVPIAADWR